MSTPTPKITVKLAITPSTFTLGSEVSLSLTAILHHHCPITIFTWPNIFNLPLAQRRKNFTCLDLTTNSYLNLELTKGGKRAGFRHELGTNDGEKYHITLEPEVPVFLKDDFKLASRAPAESSASDRKKALTPGHRYRLGVAEGEQISWWKEGRKEDALKPGRDDQDERSTNAAIILADIEAVEFVVEVTEDDEESRQFETERA